VLVVVVSVDVLVVVVSVDVLVVVVSVDVLVVVVSVDVLVVGGTTTTFEGLTGVVYVTDGTVIPLIVEIVLEPSS